MRALGLLLIANLFVFTLACSDSEPEPTIVPTTISTSIPTETPDLSAAESAVAASATAAKAHIDATPTARVEETRESAPTPTLTPQPTLTLVPTPRPTATLTPTPTSISSVDQYCHTMREARDQLEPIVEDMELTLGELVEQSEDESQARKNVQAFHRDYSDDLAPIIDSLRGRRPPEPAQQLTLSIIDQLDELAETTLVIDAMRLGNGVRAYMRQSRALIDLCGSP